MSHTSHVYVIQENAQTVPMTRIHCKDEDKELQSLLYLNPHLLPGDQINPSAPRQWIMIKREMPVQDPRIGGDRWIVDFFFADQDATPTFVECKRFLDTRSRREVIGQMLEYAANGQYYWTKESIQHMATETAKARGTDIETCIRQLGSDTIEDTGRFFELVESNLREGQIRLVFFLEEAPIELKSIVEFLNKQMERTEILIVEARQYEHHGLRVVTPSLFGYTEQARHIKRTVTITNTRQWDETGFFAELSKRVPEQAVVAARQLYDFAISYGYSIKWGRGQVTGSLNIAASQLFPKSIIQLTTEGTMYLNFGWLNGTEEIERAREAFATMVGEQLRLKVPNNYKDKFPSYGSTTWVPKVAELQQALVACFRKHTHAAE